MTRSLRSGLIPLVDSTKTTGVVFFPGTMVGMLVAGAEPVDAVRLQLILLWTLLGAVAMAALVAVSLGYRRGSSPRAPFCASYPRRRDRAPILKPRLRGVSHQWAFFVSLVTGECWLSWRRPARPHSPRRSMR